MSNHEALRAACASTSSALRDIQRFPTVTVNRVDLAELLAEFDALRAAPAPKAGKGAYSAEFEHAWADYPKRGNHSKAAAYKAWSARIKAGASMEAMFWGLQRFAAVMKAEGRENSKIMHAATFFGPDKHWETEWAPPAAAVVPSRRRADPPPETDAERDARRSRWNLTGLLGDDTGGVNA